MARTPTDSPDNRDPAETEEKYPCIGPYRLLQTLGIGSFGKVKLAQHVITGHQVAIKILNRGKIKHLQMEEKVKREINILRLFRHPHVVRTYEVIDTATDVLIVMDFVSGGDLFQHIVEKQRVSQEETLHFFQQIISGVEYFHYHRIVHRDLKPENLLLDADKNIKIVDFGLSNIMQDGEFLRTSCGSPNYAAPEVISGTQYAGPEVDVWSCGVILYALLCGSLPFDDESIPNLFKKIKAGNYTMPNHLSSSCRDLISRMLQVDPIKRIKTSEIRNHRLFKKNIPPYLKSTPEEQVESMLETDEEVINVLLGMKFDNYFPPDTVIDRSLIYRALKMDLNDRKAPQFRLLFDVRVCYELALDQKNARARFLELKRAAEERASLPQSSPITFSSIGESDGLLPTSPVKNDTERNSTPAPEKKRRRWYLGIQSKKDPIHVMNEVYAALTALNCEWGVLSPYRVRSRWRPFTVGGHDVEPIILGLQLYKVQKEIFLLDFQNLRGDGFSFMKLCAKIITLLKKSAASHSSQHHSQSHSHNKGSLPPNTNQTRPNMQHSLGNPTPLYQTPTLGQGGAPPQVQGPGPGSGGGPVNMNNVPPPLTTTTHSRYPTGHYSPGQVQYMQPQGPNIRNFDYS